MDYKDLMDGYASIEREFPKPEYRISILHGMMKAADKDYEISVSLREKHKLWWPLQLLKRVLTYLMLP